LTTKMAKILSMRFLVILFVFILGGTWTAAGGPTFEDQLRKEYAGTEQLLRYFYASDTLKFDAQGTPRNKERLVTWTLAAPVIINKVELKDSRLRLAGHRQLLVFDTANKLMKRIKLDETLAIEIETSKGADEEPQLRNALAKVFIGNDEDLAPLVPDYWRDYISRFTGRKTEGETCEESRVTAPGGTAPVQVSAGVSEGMKIQNAMPIYLPIAREHGVQGEVGIRAVIDKGGNVSRICLTKALGAGLDDMMVDTVRQWKYRPYLLNGQPVEIQTTIVTKFGLSRVRPD
jgi:TonB family protein